MAIWPGGYQGWRWNLLDLHIVGYTVDKINRYPSLLCRINFSLTQVPVRQKIFRAHFPNRKDDVQSGRKVPWAQIPPRPGALPDGAERRPFRLGRPPSHQRSGVGENAEAVPGKGSTSVISDTYFYFISSLPNYYLLSNPCKKYRDLPENCVFRVFLQFSDIALIIDWITHHRPPSLSRDRCRRPWAQSTAPSVRDAWTCCWSTWSQWCWFQAKGQTGTGVLWDVNQLACFYILRTCTLVHVFWFSVVSALVLEIKDWKLRIKRLSLKWNFTLTGLVTVYAG